MSVQSLESLEQKKRRKRGYFKYSLSHMSGFSQVNTIYSSIQYVIL